MRAFLLSFALSFSPLPTHAELSKFTENVLLHVLTHEMGHALIREFDLPILGNEESMADDFATLYLQRNFPNRVEEILKARADSWLLEADKVSIFSEYSDDAKRAGRAICLLYGVAPARHEDLAKRYGMTAREAAKCRDFAPEVARSWRRVLSDLQMPKDAPVTEVRLIIGKGPLEHELRQSETLATMQSLLEGIDWHSLITLHADHCDRGALWNRNGRTILLCDNYVQRFEKQSAQLR